MSADTARRHVCRMCGGGGEPVECADLRCAGICRYCHEYEHRGESAAVAALARRYLLWRGQRRALNAATETGYLVWRSSLTGIIHPWWNWCEAQGLPFIRLNVRRRGCELEIESMTTPEDRFPADVAPWLGRLLAEYTPPNRRRFSAAYAGAWGLTERSGRELAGRVAGLLARSRAAAGEGA